MRNILKKPSPRERRFRNLRFWPLGKARAKTRTHFFVEILKLPRAAAMKPSWTFLSLRQRQLLLRAHVQHFDTASRQPVAWSARAGVGQPGGSEGQEGGWWRPGGGRNGRWARLGGRASAFAAPHNGSGAKKDLYNHNPVMAPRPRPPTSPLSPTTSPFPRRRGLLSVEFTLALTSGAWRRVRVGCVECAGASKWACLSPRGAGTAKKPHLCGV